MVGNCVKKPKIQYDDKEIQHGLHLINNDPSIQMELEFFIVEIYVKSYKDSYFKVSMSLCSCYLIIGYIFWNAFTLQHYAIP